jgi:hypothetical protein
VTDLAVKHRNPTRWVVLGALLVLLLLLIGPLLVIAVNAVKSPADYAANGPLSIPGSLYWDGIVDFWNRVNFGQKLWNSFVTSLAVAVLGVVLSILNAYALGIGRVRGRVWFLVFFLVANLLPQEVLVYPLYYISKEAGLYDSRSRSSSSSRSSRARSARTCSPRSTRSFPGNCWTPPPSTAPANGGPCGGSSSRSAGPPSRCCSRSSSSGPGTSSSCR